MRLPVKNAGLRRFLPLFLFLLLSIWAASASSYAQDKGSDGQADNGAPSLFDKWRDYSENIWFYDKDRKEMTPDLAHDWIIVSFTGIQSASRDEKMPERIETFTTAFNRFINYHVYDPSLAASVIACKLKDGIGAEKIPEILNQIQQFEDIDYVHPALRMSDALYATLNTIEIKWKTVATKKERARLLEQVIGAPDRKVSSGEIAQVNVNEAAVPVWKAANLLAEDLHVVYAVPLYFEIQRPVTADFSVGIHGANVGSAIPFKFEVRFSERVRIEPSSIVNLDLKPSDIAKPLIDVEFDEPLSTIDASVAPILITGRLYFFTPGQYTIPPLPITYKFKEDEKTRLRQKHTQEAHIQIASIIPLEQKGLALKIAPKRAFQPDTPGTEARVRIFLVIGAVSLLIFLGCVIFGWMWVRQRAAVAPIKEPDPSEKLRQGLYERLKQDTGQMDVTEIMAVSSALRAYIVEKYNIPHSMAGGGWQTFMENVEAYVPAEIKAPLIEVLAALEANIAKQQGDSETLSNAFGETRQMLQKIEKM